MMKYKGPAIIVTIYEYLAELWPLFDLFFFYLDNILKKDLKGSNSNIKNSKMKTGVIFLCLKLSYLFKTKTLISYIYLIFKMLFNHINHIWKYAAIAKFVSFII